MDVLDDGDQIVFLRHVVPGGSDRSYGLHVAQLAGMPKAVVRRAQEILEELERAEEKSGGRDRRKGTMRGSGCVPAAAETIQLTFFNKPHPIVEEIRMMEVDGLSPLEAITKLFELQHRARAEETSSAD
jgi:DNA mismatch repair protein MutS